MVFCIVLMGYTSYYPHRKAHFNQFFNTHHLYIVFLISLLFHGWSIPNYLSVAFTAPTLVLFLCDKLFGIWQRNIPQNVT
jgi:hypothetical protein